MATVTARTLPWYAAPRVAHVMRQARRYPLVPIFILSFLLLIPTTFGAILWKGVNDVLLGDLPPGWEGPFVVGMLAAFASGLLAIVFLLGFVRRHTYAPFVVYRLIVAALVLGLIATGVREAGF
jgi:undecaprenyl-diphosphatase